jgi:hypothetical protein
MLETRFKQKYELKKIKLILYKTDQSCSNEYVKQVLPVFRNDIQNIKLLHSTVLNVKITDNL